MGTICLFVRSLAVTRHVKIIERPNETYPFAAIDQQTGEISGRCHQIHKREEAPGYSCRGIVRRAALIRVWDLSKRPGEDGYCKILAWHRQAVSRLAWCEANLVSISWDGSVAIWDVANSAPSRVITFAEI